MGMVYILQNPLYGHLIKIGYTKCNSIKGRRIITTFIPEDFIVLHMYKCKNPVLVERLIFNVFDDMRHTTLSGRKTEFFNYACKNAVIKFLEKEIKIYQKKSVSQNKKHKKPKQRTQARKNNIIFSDLGIKQGTTLVFISKNEECKVIGKNIVFYKNKEYRLSNLAAELHKKYRLGKTTSYNGWRFFKVKGENLTLADKRKLMGL